MRTAIALLSLAAAPAMADPSLGGPMSHLLVSVFQQQVFLSFESPSMSTVVMQDGDGFGGDAGVLNGTGYNAQFGWLANGFVSIPPGSGVFVREIGGSPWLSVYSEFGFDPILGTAGSDPVWQWNGTMTHNWYATEVHGRHEVTYEVFVGDAGGNPLAGWTPGEITLAFEYGRERPVLGVGGSIDLGAWGASTRPTPAAGPLAALAVGGLVSTRRRR